jgi:hypothetical protein
MVCAKLAYLPGLISHSTVIIRNHEMRSFFFLLFRSVDPSYGNDGSSRGFETGPVTCQLTLYSKAVLVWPSRHGLLMSYLTRTGEFFARAEVKVGEVLEWSWAEICKIAVCALRKMAVVPVT